MAVTQTTVNGLICTNEAENKQEAAQEDASFNPRIKSEVRAFNPSRLSHFTEKCNFSWMKSACGQITDNVGNKHVPSV